MKSFETPTTFTSTAHPTHETDTPQLQPPAYEDTGRIDIDCDSKFVRTLSELYVSQYKEYQKEETNPAYRHEPEPISEEPQAQSRWATRLNIVIQIVGSRGDVQPFIALGNELQKHGHRVRLATHDVFSTFVRDAGLEFFPIGGNPVELMAYMVKNPGLVPSMESIIAGEIQQKRYMVEEMLGKFWKSCLEPDPLTGEPFAADAIIANPPSFAHIHCAEALGIPVHLMFTMPWTNTSAFPHPLANLTGAREPGMANFMSYSVVEWMTWQGLGDVVNKWRLSLDLEEVAMFDAPLMARALKIPFTYCWSPALVPKPVDWPSYIDVAGFFFRDTPSYAPPPDLTEFLKSGPPPVYIGFGSIVLDDPDKMTHTILEAVHQAGTRAIVSKGWSNLSASGHDNIYWIGDCPHEWLFQHVAAVVHHGGAGTTACGLRNGKPTTIIPFFGDQPFWGEMVASAGAGPSPIPHTKLTSDALAQAILFCLSPSARQAATSLATRMKSEDGIKAAVRSFHRNLPLESMRCDIIPTEPAVWSYCRGKRVIKLSGVAAELAISGKAIDSKHLKLHQSKPCSIPTTRWDPITGGASAVMATSVDVAKSITEIFTKPVGEYRSELHRRENTQDANHGDTRPSLAGKMATASASSLGNVATNTLKGTMIDIPLALTEGLRSIPQHMGGTVRDHGAVTDAKSGSVVGAKTFAWGFIDGLSDVVMEPYRGARDEGALGAVKGVGKGTVNLVTKSGAGMFGLVAYPSAGIAKSLRTAFHTSTRKAIIQQRHKEGEWKLQTARMSSVNRDEVLAEFQRISR